MRLQIGLFLGLVFFLFGMPALAQGRGRTLPQVGKASSGGPASRVSSPGYGHHGGWSPGQSPRFNRGFAFRSPSYWPYAYSPYAAPSYGWPHVDAGDYGFPYTYASPYTHSGYFPYLYFFDLYYREAQRSKEEADAYEETFRREKLGDAASGGAPLSPRDVQVTVDGQELAPSPSGYPLVVGSGRHTLRLAARSPARTEEGVRN